MAIIDNPTAPLIPGPGPTKEDRSTTTTPLMRRRYQQQQQYQDWKPTIPPFSSKKKDRTLIATSSPLPHLQPQPHPQSKKQPRPLYALIILASYLALGTLCFYSIRAHLDGKKTNPVIDALYLSIVTMTTVGYGDLVPGTPMAKLLTCLFVFSGMAIVGTFLSKVADYLVEKQELMLAKAIHMAGEVNVGGVASAEIDEHSSRAKYKLMVCLGVLAVMMAAGVVVLTKVERMGVVDAVYCVCATVTTLGFGDRSFGSEGGRAFAVFWILGSTVCLAQVFFYLTEMYAESRERSLLKYVVGRQLTFADIEAADLDNDNVLSAAEFILYKLKEMEKIEDDDIAPLMDCFKNLDVDHSGTLTTSDVIHAQSSSTSRPVPPLG